MKISITGPPGSGKTTLLKRIVNRLGGFFGFYTEEVRVGGRRRGFKVVPLPEGEPFLLASVDPSELRRPSYRIGKYIVDKRALDEIVSILKESLNEDRVAIDEVGKMELLHPEFRPLITGVLDADKTVVLTFGKNIDKFYKRYIELKTHVVELNKRGDAEKRLPIILERLRRPFYPLL